ncbi:TPA: hypothetical protein ACXIIH_004478, partial [Enterobacter hormaechei]
GSKETGPQAALSVFLLLGVRHHALQVKLNTLSLEGFELKTISLKLNSPEHQRNNDDNRQK